MKKQLLTSVLAISALVPVVTGQANSAQALSLGTTCSTTIAGKVSPNLGCELGTENNDRVNLPLQVNQDSIFNFNDWSFAGKDEVGGTLNFSSFPTDTTSGTFDLNSFIGSNWTQAMVVFKGGQGNIRPEEYVAYLLNLDSLPTTWNSPFANSRNNIANVSHISLYYREGAVDPEPIPTPALVPAAIGMGVALLRKKKQEEAAHEV